MNELKNINGISCVYEIRNLTNNHVYIGSTNNLLYRKNAHTNSLKKGTHFNPKLQRAWNKYGEDSFELDILVYCDQDKLFEKEQEFLDSWKPEYNISTYAYTPTRRGGKLSPEHVEKIRAANIGNIRSEESKRKQSESRKGIKYSDETKKLWSKQRTGHEYTAKTHNGLVSPEGIVYESIFNLAKFCRDHQLHDGHIKSVLDGSQPYHKGWVAWKGIVPSECKHEFISNKKQGKKYCKFCNTPEKIVIRGCYKKDY